MRVIFSRHAKQRIRLYRIDESDVIKAIDRFLITKASFSGKFFFIDEESVQKYLYPVKVVAISENDIITVITVYPLKKGLKV